MPAIQVNVCYILKHLDDRKALSAHIYYTWCDIILIFNMHRRTRLTPRSSIHSLKIRMTSHLYNKYEKITLSYFLSVNYTILKQSNLNRTAKLAVIYKNNTTHSFDVTSERML